jgi:ATP-dependent Clp protease protease subunit
MSQAPAEEPTPLMYDPFLAARTIRVFGEIDSDVAQSVFEHIYILEVLDPDEPIKLYINSPGGDVYAMFAIVDTIKSTTCPVYTIGSGQVMSAATLILAAGTPGHRSLFPNTTLMLHEAFSAVSGKLTDITIHHKETTRLQKLYIKLLEKYTGTAKADLVSYILGSDYYFSPTQALKLGLADKITKKLI